MFGDPCPGTLKYLEVQYHCVHGMFSARKAQLYLFIAFQLILIQHFIKTIKTAHFVWSYSLDFSF
jgi:hypothetical protein